jgi:hypothetical protein
MAVQLPQWTQWTQPWVVLRVMAVQLPQCQWTQWTQPWVQPWTALWIKAAQLVVMRWRQRQKLIARRAVQTQCQLTM